MVRLVTEVLVAVPLAEFASISAAFIAPLAEFALISVVFTVIKLVSVVDMLASSLIAAANSFSVSKAAGALSTNAATLISV